MVVTHLIDTEVKMRDVTIPGEIDGLPVTVLSNMSAEGWGKIVKVTIPVGTKITEKCFFWKSCYTFST